ncbi:MAG: hypothetical protein Q9160_003868 [Pyrenula sp. 1 TL-2023]
MTVMVEPPSGLQDNLHLIARGKVRNLYEIDSQSLLFVASDRVSAYDVVLKNGIPEKGMVLTLLSHHWFNVLKSKVPELQTHFLSLEIPSHVPKSFHSALQRRSMQVRKLKPFPIEAIVRGYITGSAWSEYRKSGLMNGVELPKGLRESQEFPNGPIYTPSTKAELGAKDENITIEEGKLISLPSARTVGHQYASQIEKLSLQLYKAGRDYARERGIIIADTKFEFGLDEETNTVVLIDEVLTPDSSRFWPLRQYEVGKGQESFDKQYLRDWLTAGGLKGKDGVEMPEAVVKETARRYREAYEILTGSKWEDIRS